MADKDFKVKNGIDVAGNANIDGNLNAAKYQTSAPSSPVTGQLWIDSDASAGVLNQNDYLLKSDASASSGYLLKTDAASTYETQAEAASTYAPLASPTLTGTVSLPSTTSIGDVSSIEIGYLNNASANIQTQLNSKAASSAVVSSFNGVTGAITGVNSVNGSTGAVTGLATTAGKLSQFAATTSAELAGVISNETGTGSLVFNGSPTFTGTINAAALTLSGNLISNTVETNTLSLDYIAGGNGATLSSAVGFYYTENATSNYSTYSRLTSGSYDGIIHRSGQGRASNTASDFILCQSNTNATTDTDFVVRGDGRIASDVATITSPADYAEYFEWVDGNPNAEDRVGISVVLVGNKIVEATENSEDIIGIVSGRPGFIGDTAWSHWNEKYLIDDFGRRIIEDYEVYQWTETDSEGKVKELAYAFDDFTLQDVEVPEDHTVVIQQRDKVNLNYDPDVEYVPREDRQEWDAIGLVGKVRMIKGKPVNPRWRKLQDIKDTVEEWFIR
jgi:hypothetical protein